VVAKDNKTIIVIIVIFIRLCLWCGGSRFVFTVMTLARLTQSDAIVTDSVTICRKLRSVILTYSTSFFLCPVFESWLFGRMPQHAHNRNDQPEKSELFSNAKLNRMNSSLRQDREDEVHSLPQTTYSTTWYSIIPGREDCKA
jgi:hypothetical protein